jgi:hypothetical protein
VEIESNYGSDEVRVFSACVSQMSRVPSHVILGLMRSSYQNMVRPGPGLTVLVVVKSSAILLTLVDFVIFQGRHSSLNFPDFLLITSIFAKNK